MSSSDVNVEAEYVIGPELTPFFTTRWSPVTEQPKAYILFVHGFSEHIQRYDHFFRKLAAAPHFLHVTAFDQRGFGRTSQAPLVESSPEAQKWKADGIKYKLEKHAMRKSGGWAKVFVDIEFFVQKESARAQAAGKKLFLYGHSMGGGEVLAFGCGRGPHKDTIKLVSGIIASGPLIRLPVQPSTIELKLGGLVASLGMGNMLRTTPLDVNDFTHDKELAKLAGEDPLNQPVGTLRGIADMVNGGAWLDSKAAWNAWANDLPLLVYHGSEDKLTDHKASERFVEHVVAKDKTVKIYHGLYHEVHNEEEPHRTEAANFVADWILAHSAEGPAQAKL